MTGRLQSEEICLSAYLEPVKNSLAATTDERLAPGATPLLVLHNGLDLLRGQDLRRKNALFELSEGHGRKADEVKDSTQFFADVFGVQTDVPLLQGGLCPGQSGLEEQLFTDFKLVH